MKFRRAAGAKVEVNWNPKNGPAKPFENVTDDMNIPVKHRSRNVVTMNGEYYQVSKSWYDFHPDLDNGAVLVPLEKAY